MKKAIAAMTRALAHRGPDAEGSWVSTDGVSALGHRRLSIIDLTEKGNQPMESPSKRYLIAYNGELYNYQELREDLICEGHTFRSESDTEVVLTSIEFWGLEGALDKMVGMFAFALWDQQQKCFYLVRDRYGKKPLYLGHWEWGFAFGSEISSVEAVSGGALHLDRLAVDQYLRRGYFVHPATVYKEIRQVAPGEVVILRSSGAATSKRFWTVREHVKQARQRQTDFHTADDSVETVLPVLQLAVRQRMVSDVKLGAFLSGGIDSSTVVALMQEASEDPIRTFTVGFEDEAYDEAHSANQIAEHLGTLHTELTLTAKQIQDSIPKLASVYGEPFGDPSAMPTYFVSQLARDHVKVVLTGDGGDEVFGGYNRHILADSWWSRAARVPMPLRRLTAYGLTRLPPAGWDRVYASTSWAVPARMKLRLPGDKIYKIAAALHSSDGSSLHERLLSFYPLSEQVVHGAPHKPVSNHRSVGLDLSLPESMMVRDAEEYLPGDVLTKVDRATMAFGLEARAPFLDHRVSSVAWRLPLHHKIHNGKGKIILRQILKRYIPDHLFERPKMGFGIPIGEWIRGPLFEWANALLDERRIREEGVLRNDLVQKLWQEHQQGRRRWDDPLWAILMFQQWLDTRGSAAPDDPPGDPLRRVAA